LRWGRPRRGSRSRLIAGSATFTTVPSTKTIAVPRIAATSVYRFCVAVVTR